MKRDNEIPKGYKDSPLGIVPMEWEKKNDMDFGELSIIIKQTHELTQVTAVKAINKVATIRNWLIGYYIVEFEQCGKDRAAYGNQLLQRLEESVNTKGLNVTLFKNARSFYNNYPQVGNLFYTAISPTVSDEFKTPAQTLISLLSFSHICEILTLDDSLTRYFYETECIKCSWSVRELRRQISTNLFVRCGISKKPEELLATLQTQEYHIKDDIKQPCLYCVEAPKRNMQ